MFAPAWRRPLVIGVLLAVLQQFTGINAIIYYADKVFAAAGFATPASQSLATLWAIGAVNVVATFVAVAWVDRFGRRPLAADRLGGHGGQPGRGGRDVRTDAEGRGPHRSGTTTTGVMTLIGLVVFIASFAFSLGPVVWTIINEIFPSHIRGRAVAVATAANWFAAWLVSQFFLSLVDLITEAGHVLAVRRVLCRHLRLRARFVPETKGRSLEEVEQLWGDPDAIREAIGRVRPDRAGPGSAPTG